MSDEESEIGNKRRQDNNDNDLRERRRRQRLQKELEELKEGIFPGDDGYEEIIHTTPVEDNRIVEGDNDEYNDEDDPYNDQDLEDEEEEEGEDLMEKAHLDYQKLDVLDQYDAVGLDDTEYEAMNADTRRIAEEDMNRRDMLMGGGRGRQGALSRALTDWMEQEEQEDDRQLRRTRLYQTSAAAASMAEGEDGEQQEEEIDEEDEDDVNLEAMPDVSLEEWIVQDRTRRAIQKKFKTFLQQHEYEEKVREMCGMNGQSLYVAYPPLMEGCTLIALWLVDAPSTLLQILSEAATQFTVKYFPHYTTTIAPQVLVRITQLPLLDSLRDLRQKHLHSFIQVCGVVTRRTTISPQLETCFYNCQKCSFLLGPFDASTTPSQCSNCQTEVGPFVLNKEKSLYVNVQKMVLQEAPGSVAPGRVPRSKEVILKHDLMDIARPGELVQVCGIYNHAYDPAGTHQSGFPIFTTHIEANCVMSQEKDDVDQLQISPKDLKEIQRLAKLPNIKQLLIKSMAPSIHGQEHVKLALLLSLLGGVRKQVSDKHTIRGDIHVLLLGDPGTAKSQMLQYTARLAPRAVCSTGKGASAVGLTASVHKDPMTKEWTLEGGALVLADDGVCCIDEFDKMNEQDRTSIHEAMEQQSMSVSKAGIVTSLQARCAVIAAANPIGGRYDSSCTLSDNVNLTDPILQRFDIPCILQDTVDPIADEQLATFVTQSHMSSLATATLVRNEQSYSTEKDEEDVEGDGLSVAIMKKYIQYARTQVRPVLREAVVDQEKIASLYVKLRKESMVSGGVPIAVRHVESLMRMAEAHAKLHLRDYVREDDVNSAIGVLLESFIQAQKFSVQKQLRRNFDRYTSTSDSHYAILLQLLQELFRNEAMYQSIRSNNKDNNNNQNLEVTLQEFTVRAHEKRLYELQSFLSSTEFQQAGYVYHEQSQIISRQTTTTT